MSKRGVQGRGCIRQRGKKDKNGKFIPAKDKNGKPIWEGIYSTGRNLNGKRVQRSVYGESQADVRDQLDKILNTIKTGVYVEPSKMTVSDWLDEWCASYLDGVKERTRANYEAECKNHIKPALGSIKLQELKAPAIKQFYKKLQKDVKYTDKKGVEKIKPGLSAKSVRNIAGVLHAALEVAADDEHNYIPVNPASKVKLPSIVKPDIKPLDEDAMAAFLKEIRGHRLEHLFYVTLMSGFRQGEVLGLQWTCVDFKKGTIKVDKQLQRNVNGGGGLDKTKNSKSRLLHPAQSVMTALWEQRRLQLEMQFKAGQLWDNKDNLCFTNEFGGVLVHGTISKTFKRLITAAGYPDARFHDLRHSYAVASLASGADIKSVQESLGHHSAAFTMDCYMHSTEKMMKESANKLESFMQSIKSS